MYLAKRLIDFVSLVMMKGISTEDVPDFARSHLLEYEERNTVIYCYGAYDEIEEHHPEKDLVIKFISDSGMEIHTTWQGVSITLKGNFPDMGWDHDEGEFGLGGDWWKGK